MLKRDITYENPFTEKQVTEEHFFHISKADLVEMEIEETGTTYTKDGDELTGMQAKLQRIVDTLDGKAIMAEFKDIIRRSYGIKDGDRFRKSREIWDDFASTEAFSQLLFELCTKPDEAAAFINGVVPHNLDQIAAEVQAEAEKATQQAAYVEAAKSTGHPSDTAAQPAPPPFEDTTERQRDISQATPEKPVTLTPDEVQAMDSDELKSGVATGRYRLN